MIIYFFDLLFLLLLKNHFKLVKRKTIWEYFSTCSTMHVLCSRQCWIISFKGHCQSYIILPLEIRLFTGYTNFRNIRRAEILSNFKSISNKHHGSLFKTKLKSWSWYFITLQRVEFRIATNEMKVQYKKLGLRVVSRVAETLKTCLQSSFQKSKSGSSNQKVRKS